MPYQCRIVLGKKLFSQDVELKMSEKGLSRRKFLVFVVIKIAFCCLNLLRFSLQIEAIVVNLISILFCSTDFRDEYLLTFTFKIISLFNHKAFLLHLVLFYLVN